MANLEDNLVSSVLVFILVTTVSDVSVAPSPKVSKTILDISFER